MGMYRYNTICSPVTPSLRPEQNGHHFGKNISMNENVRILLKCVSEGLIDDKVTAWAKQVTSNYLKILLAHLNNAYICNLASMN